MDIQAKSVDMIMDMDEKFHIHGNPGHCTLGNNSLQSRPASSERHQLSAADRQQQLQRE